MKDSGADSFICIQLSSIAESMHSVITRKQIFEQFCHASSGKVTGT